ncbi:MAG: helix-turn-helix transcriptional regulator [Ignavibacteriota bacterium]
MNLQKIVADNIRGFRKIRNLSQEALAIKSGISPNYLACVERSEVGIALARLEKLAKTLKVEPHLLLIRDAYKDTLSLKDT